MTLICFILIVHFVADFIVQTDEQARGKSGSLYPLIAHITSYSIALWFALICYSYFDRSVTGLALYVFWNGLAHFVTDLVSSRVGKARWEAGDRRGFFIVVGADQLVHSLCLILSIPLFLVK